ncbi:MAG: YceI family protein, partial [Shimia sp.]
RSEAAVIMDTAGARTSLPFATDVMRGADVLHTEAHPTARFATTAFAGTLNGGTLRGTLTLRGVSQGVTLAVDVFRPRDADEGDLSRLILRMEGQLDRRLWGITAYAGVVEPMVGLSVRAQLDRV